MFVGIVHDCRGELLFSIAIIKYFNRNYASMSTLSPARQLMPAELDELIDESISLRRKMQMMQEEYNSKRKRIFEILCARNLKYYQHGMCRAVRTEAMSIESVSKQLFIKALQEVDIPRDKKIFIWNRALKEIKRPATVVLQVVAASATAGFDRTAGQSPGGLP